MKTKALFFAAALLAAGLQSGAQTLENAIMFSDDNVLGTARSMAMGNAMTALGSDLGSVQINPAGSAVASYSQFVVSPGLSIVSTAAGFGAATPKSEEIRFGNPTSYDKTRFKLPSVGAIIYLDTGRGYGLKSVSFGIMAVQSSSYDAGWHAMGRSGDTSISGLLASNATGRMDPMILSNSNRWSYGDWSALTGYYGGLISYLREKDWYFGAAETVEPKGDGYDVFVKGDLNNSIWSETAGYKTDFTLNFGTNISDKFYIGINLGLPMGKYTNTYEVQEVPVDRNDFQNRPAYYSSAGEWVESDELRKFSGLSYIDYERMSLTGVYGKIGVICLPTDFLRLGAAIRTPALFTIVQEYQTSVRAEYNCNSSDRFSATASSPSDARTSFKFNSAWGFNVGAAVTLGQSGLVSVDYEMTDFSHMEYRAGSSRYAVFGDPFAEVNGLIRDNCGVSHNLRIGAEVNALPFLPVRLGYTLRTNPTKSGAEVFNARNTVSFGLGFISAGSFFMDAAARCNINPKNTVPIYGDYCPNYFSPTVQINKNTLWDVVLTLGWRF